MHFPKHLEIPQHYYIVTWSPPVQYPLSWQHKIHQMITCNILNNQYSFQYILYISHNLGICCAGPSNTVGNEQQNMFVGRIDRPFTSYCYPHGMSHQGILVAWNFTTSSIFNDSSWFTSWMCYPTSVIQTLNPHLLVQCP